MASIVIKCVYFTLKYSFLFGDWGAGLLVTDVYPPALFPELCTVDFTYHTYSICYGR